MFFLNGSEHRSTGYAYQDKRTVVAQVLDNLEPGPHKVYIRVDPTISRLYDHIMERTPTIRVFNSFNDSSRSDTIEYRNMSPEERLDLVERLRLEAGRLNYEYPARFRRVLAVTRKV